MLMGASMIWGSKKQSSVSLSRSDAENMEKSEPELKIKEDNQSCFKMTKNRHHGRAEHIDIKYHHIRDEDECGEAKLEYARLRKCWRTSCRRDYRERATST